MIKILCQHRLTYDNATHTTINTEGVDIIQPGFGDTATVEWLDTFHVYPLSEYLVNLS